MEYVSYAFWRLLFSLAVVAAIALPGSSAQAQDDDVLRVGWHFLATRTEGELKRLDPARSYAERDIVVLVDLFEPPIHSLAGGLEPGGAKAWAFRDGGNTLTLSLDERKRWSDGQPVTAHDFVFAYRRLAAPKYADQLLSFIASAIVGLARHDERPLAVRALDDYTLELGLTSPYALDPALFAHPQLFPMPRHAAPSDPLIEWASWPNAVSNGAYVLDDLDGGVARLQRNPFYRVADGEGVFSRVEHQVLAWSDLASRFINDEVDLINRISPNQLVWFEGRDLHRQVSSVSADLLILNMQDPVLKDARVRHALRLAMNKPALAIGLEREYGQVSYSMVPSGYMGYTADFQEPAPSEALAAAQGLMRDAGFSEDRRLTLSFMTDDIDYARQLVNALAVNWSQIYVDIIPEFVEDHASYWDKVLAADYQLGRHFWNPDYRSPGAFLNYCLGAEPIPYCGFFQDDRVGEYFAKAVKATSVEERNRMYLAAEKTIREATPTIPLVYRYQSMLASKALDIDRLEPLSRFQSVLVRKDLEPER